MRFACFFLLAIGLWAQVVSPQPPPLVAVPEVVAPQNPAHFAAIGLGFQANKKITGWMNICTNVTAGGSTYACIATDMTGGVSSTRAGVEKLIFRQGVLALAIKGDAGIATGATSGTGGSYGVGGSVLLDISKWTKVSNLYAVGSISCLKSNVVDTTATPGIFSIFGAQGVYRFGFGRTF